MSGDTDKRQRRKKITLKSCIDGEQQGHTKTKRNFGNIPRNNSRSRKTHGNRSRSRNRARMRMKISRRSTGAESKNK